MPLFTLTWNYQVEAPFVLKTDNITFLPAPFDGYIDEVEVEPGDIVTQGQQLLSLDIRELTLEETAALADVSQRQTEAEKARAERNLADMNIAKAQEEQAKAELDKVTFQLSHARLLAPFEGVVAEGDLKKCVGLPFIKEMCY